LEHGTVENQKLNLLILKLSIVQSKSALIAIKQVLKDLQQAFGNAVLVQLNLRGGPILYRIISNGIHVHELFEGR